MCSRSSQRRSARAAKETNDASRLQSRASVKQYAWCSFDLPLLKYLSELIFDFFHLFRIVYFRAPEVRILNLFWKHQIKDCLWSEFGHIF